MYQATTKSVAIIGFVLCTWTSVYAVEPPSSRSVVPPVRTKPQRVTYPGVNWRIRGTVQKTPFLLRQKAMRSLVRLREHDSMLSVKDHELTHEIRGTWAATLGTSIGTMMLPALVATVCSLSWALGHTGRLPGPGFAAMMSLPTVHFGAMLAGSIAERRDLRRKEIDTYVIRAIKDAAIGVEAIEMPLLQWAEADYAKRLRKVQKEARRANIKFQRIDPIVRSTQAERAHERLREATQKRERIDTNLELVSVELERRRDTLLKQQQAASMNLHQGI